MSHGASLLSLITTHNSEVMQTPRQIPSFLKTETHGKVKFQISRYLYRPDIHKKIVFTNEVAVTKYGIEARLHCSWTTFRLTYGIMKDPLRPPRKWIPLQTTSPAFPRTRNPNSSIPCPIINHRRLRRSTHSIKSIQTFVA